jgi:hypothetical protein
MLAVIQRRGPAQELRATIDRLPLDVRQGILDGIKDQRIIAGAHADVRGGVCPMVAADVPWQSVSKSSVATAQQAARAWDRYAEASGSSRTASKRQLLALTSMLEASILQDQALTEPPLSDAIADYQRAKSGLRSTAIPPTPTPTPTPTPVPVPDAFPDTPVAQPTYLGLADAYEVVPTERPTERPLPVELPAARPSAVELPSAVEPPAELPSAAEMPAERPSAVDVPAERRSTRKRRETGERDRTSELAERDGWAWMRPFRSYDEYEETLLRALAELDSQERQLEELQIR